MTRILVVPDASVLIGLARIDRLSILPALFAEILTPQAVWNEAAAEAGPRPGAAVLRATKWLRVARVQDVARLSEMRRSEPSLGAGEIEVVCLAAERAADWALIDDREGRRLAKRLGVPTMGTAGVLALAKRSGLVEDLDAVFEDLARQGFYLSESARRSARELAKA